MKTVPRILMILILPLLIIGGTNYFFDPDYTLRKNYIPPLVEALSNGEMISGPVNINSRLLKSQWIENLPECPEVLVMGSSRTLNLSHVAFPRKTFFNASVTNCTFQDMYAFLNLFEKNHEKLPQTVIVCPDQWLFGNSFTEKRWLINRDDFVEMTNKIGEINLSSFPSKWNLEKEWIKELFSVRYFLRSVNYHGKVEKFNICHSVDSSKMMFLPDGSRHLPDQLIHIPENELLQHAENYFYSSKDEQFKNLDPIQCQLFERMILYLKERNCELVLFIPPYHPETFNLLKQSPETVGVFMANQFVMDFAEEYQINVIGDTNPKNLNLLSEDFYDAVHLKQEPLINLFKNQLP